MIKRIECENVRLFDRPYRVDLAPITVICGTNSSGKSTLVKLPIILRQALGISEAYEPRRGQLRMAGSQVDMGSFATVVSHNDVALDMEIAITIVESVPKATYDVLQALQIRGIEVVAPKVDHMRHQFRWNSKQPFDLASCWRLSKHLESPASR